MKENLRIAGFVLGVIGAYVLIAVILTLCLTMESLEDDVEPLTWGEVFPGVILSGWLWMIFGAVLGYYHGKRVRKAELFDKYSQHKINDSLHFPTSCPFCEYEKNPYRDGSYSSVD